MFVKNLPSHCLGRGHVGKVADIGMQLESGVREFLYHLVQLLLVAGDGDHMCASFGEFPCRRLADPGRRTSDEDDLALDLAAETAIDEEVRI